MPFKADGKGTIGRWRPVVVRSPIAMDAKKDAKIFIDVKLPPDARQGMLVEKKILRVLGKTSAPKFSAYLSACYLWDKYGTVMGKLLDPTRPIERRNAENVLVDANGTPLVNSRGRELTNIYAPEAVRQSGRQPNPEVIKKYPVLSNDDLIRSCFPNTTDSNQRKLLKKAKEHWTELERNGVVSIHKEREGWRILPDSGHLQEYRAVKIAQKKKQKKR